MEAGRGHLASIRELESQLNVGSPLCVALPTLGFSNASGILGSPVHMEKTFVIFKPDCMEQHHVGAVLSRFEAAGFDVIGCKMTLLSPALLREHYAHVADKPFYPEIEKFMASRPVIMIAMQGANIVQRVRDLLGPTDSRKAAKGTIRGDFGTEMMKNVVHASDTVDNAKTVFN